MVHSNDPLRPRKVLCRGSKMRRLPIENSRGTAEIETADDVLWPGIAVDDHIPLASEVWNGRGTNRLKDGELPSDES
jgi:hypothetical protein